MIEPAKRPREKLLTLCVFIKKKFLKTLFITYLREKKREGDCTCIHEQGGKQRRRGRESEADAVLSVESNSGLDPRSLRW